MFPMDGNKACQTVKIIIGEMGAFSTLLSTSIEINTWVEYVCQKIKQLARFPNNKSILLLFIRFTFGNIVTIAQGLLC